MTTKSQPTLDAQPPTAVVPNPSWYDPVVVIWLLRLVSVALIAVVVSTGHPRIDREDVAVPAYAIASGHLSDAYPTALTSSGRPLAFQPPGFPIFAATFIATWHRVVGNGGNGGALTFAGYGAVAIVVIAGGLLVGAGRGGRRREVLFLIAISVSPFFRESLGNYFHPEDVLALGLLLLSLSLVSRGRWLWAGGCLGLAMGCKQWVLLAVPALLLMSPGRQAKWRFLAATLGGAALLYLPFVWFTSGSAWRILRGPAPVPGGFVPQTTMIGMLREAPFHISMTEVNDLARLLPLLFATLLAGLWALVIYRRYGTVPRPSMEQVLGLLLASVAFRLVGDCIALSYYAVPFSVLIVIVGVWRSRFPAFAIVSSFVLACWYGTGTPRHFLGPWAGAEAFTVCVAAITVGALVTRRDRADPSRSAAVVKDVADVMLGRRNFASQRFNPVTAVDPDSDQAP